MINLNFAKRLPISCAKRKVVVSTRAYRRYWTHSLDAIHSDIFQAIDEWVQSGDVVWDIGANCGVFTYGAAIRSGSSGKVIVVEADLQCAALIDRSAKHRVDDEAPVTICPFAVSDTDGVVNIRGFELSLGSQQLGGVRTVQFRWCQAFRSVL